MSGDRPDVRVVGAGGHAKVVIATLRDCGRPVSAVFDDDETKIGGTVLGVPVVAPPLSLSDGGTGPVVLAIGDNRMRRDVAGRLDSVAATCAIHPAAHVDPTARIGPGTVVFAGAVIQAEARIGSHVIINTGATVDHDCVIGDFAHVAPGVHLAGNVEVGEGALVGIGSVVLPGVRIGRWATVGAGAAVAAEVADGATVVGVPARRAGERSP